MIVSFGKNIGMCKRKLIKKTFQACAKEVGIDFPIELSLNFASEEEIRQLNSKHRNLDRPTDVLSFPSVQILNKTHLKKSNFKLEEIHKGFSFLGDIVICPKIARSQAKEFGNSFVAELQKLCIHSFLHLCGYDHETELGYEEMSQLETKIFMDLKKR